MCNRSMFQFFSRKIFIFVCLLEHVLRNGIVNGVFTRKFSKEIIKIARNNYIIISQENHQRPKCSRIMDLEIWSPFFDRMGKLIPIFKNTKEAIDYCQTKIMFDHRSIIQPTVVRMFIHYERILKKEFRGNLRDFSSLFESDYSCNKSLFKFEGKIVSGIFYWHAYLYLSIISKFQRHYKPSTICEIGGGYGALARLFILNKKNFDFKRYVLIDHESSLFFAETFLRQNFSSVKFSYLCEKVDQNAEVIFCPFSKLHHLKDLKIDIIINTGSFQEMPPDWISFYLNWVDDVDASYLYSCNYFGQSIDNLGESQNFFCPEMSANWSLTYSRQNPTILWMQTQNRDFGEFFFERKHIGTKKNKNVKTIKCQQDFMDCFFKIKSTEDTKLIWDFVQTTIRDLNYVPKEILFLLEKISSCPNFGKEANKLQTQLLIQVSKTKYADLEEIFGADC